MTEITKVEIRRINLGQRVRKELGDVTGLAASIQELGLLQPVVLRPDFTLIAGARRIAAAESLKWTKIPAYIISELKEAAELLKAERDENTQRKSFSPSEAVAMGEKLEAMEKPKAAERKIAGNKSGGRGKKKLGGNLPPSKTRETVGAALGLSGRSYEKAKAVVAKAPDLIPEMDRTRNIQGAFQKLQKRERDAKRQEAAKGVELDTRIIVGDFREKADAIPNGSLSLIFTDPPYDKDSEPLFANLGKFGAEKLADGGSLVCYVGHVQLAAALESISKYLRFWWPCACVHSDSKALLREYGLRAGWKPMLWFVKGTRHDKSKIISDTVSGGREKGSHDWQQAEAEAAHFIDGLCVADGIVCDPFLGGGTTAVAAMRLNRKWIGFEKDAATAAQASQRIR